MATHTKAKQYDYHEFCLPFGLMKQPDLEALADDIKERGLDKPLVLFENKILDGRNRNEACKMVGVVPRTIDFNGSREKALAFVAAANHKRRHDTDADRAIQAAKLAEFFRPAADERKKSGTTLPANAGKVGESIELAAEAVGASPASAERAATVLNNASPEVIAAMESGAVSISDAAAVAHEPKKKQKAAVAKVRKKKAKTLKAAVKEQKAADDDEGGYEPHEAKREFAKLKKSLAACARHYGEFRSKVGESPALKAVFKGIDDASKAFENYQRQFKRACA